MDIKIKLNKQESDWLDVNYNDVDQFKADIINRLGTFFPELPGLNVTIEKED